MEIIFDTRDFVYMKDTLCKSSNYYCRRHDTVTSRRLGIIQKCFVNGMKFKKYVIKFFCTTEGRKFSMKIDR